MLFYSIRLFLLAIRIAVDVFIEQETVQDFKSPHIQHWDLIKGTLLGSIFSFSGH